MPAYSSMNANVFAFSSAVFVGPCDLNLNRIVMFDFKVKRCGLNLYSVTVCGSWHGAYKSPSLFMLFHNEWKINTCLIRGIKEWPLLPVASVATAWYCQIAVRTGNPGGMSDGNIKNGRVGLNTSACFIGVRSATCVYLLNKWISRAAQA